MPSQTTTQNEDRTERQAIPLPEETQVQQQQPSTPTPTPPVQAPRVGIIFGPGGARSYAAIGFLQELQKYRVPVKAVGGVEWGAMVGAFYALKGSLNDVEWQLAKIRSQEPMGDMDDLKKFLNETLSKYNVEQIKLPFSCPALNLSKNQTYNMNKGPLNQLLPYCVAYPPIYRPHNANISGMRDLKTLAQHLRSQGANYIVLVNVLGEPGTNKNITGNLNSPENVFWNEIAGYYSKPGQGVDHIVNLNVDGFSLFDFDRKRDIIQKGASSSSRWVQEFTNKYGF
jgi:NTE family protein